MSAFPDTPTALLTRIAADVSGENQAIWYEFVELYDPTMRTYLSCKGVADSDMDDIVQDVFAKLVDILRSGGYCREKGRFRTYLSHVLYNEAVDRYRRAMARRAHLHQPLEEGIPDETVDAGSIIDAQWRMARHTAAVRHVLERTALSGLTKRIFRELEETGDTCEAVAKRLKVSAAAVRQVKSRVGKMVAVLESRFEQ